MIKLLLIDNYDSFTHNLYHLFAALPSVEVQVLRNDDGTMLSRIEAGDFDGIIIGPGPGSPDDAEYFGSCMEIIRTYGRILPILGVCLGFQGIAHALGAKLKKATSPMHGKLSRLDIHTPSKLLEGVANTAEVMRYHSIMIDAESDIPNEIVITAEVTATDEGGSIAANGREIMALEHREFPLFGVQYHPESYVDSNGTLIAQNFVAIATKYRTLSNSSRDTN